MMVLISRDLQTRLDNIVLNFVLPASLTDRDLLHFQDRQFISQEDAWLLPFLYFLEKMLEKWRQQKHDRSNGVGI
jgi:hypothetical protein